jgi:xylulokinase
MSELLMGIDIGSTNIRCVIYDIKGQAVSFASCGSEPARDIFGGFCETLMEAVYNVCRKAVSQIDGPFFLHGLAVASVGCGTMVVGKDGRLIRLEGDTEPFYKAVNEKINPSEAFNTTGYELEPGNIVFRLAAQKRLNPSVYDEVDIVLSVADFVAYRLTGIKKKEYSTACSTGAWDNHKREWWANLSDGTEKDRLGVLSNSGALVGPVLSAEAEKTSIPAGTRVYMGGHDYLCSAFASGCYKGSTVLNMTGTYEIMATFHENPLKKTKSMKIRPIVDNHVVPGKFSFQLEAVGAGHTEWLRENIFGIKGEAWFDCFARLDEQKPKPSSLLFIPHVFGQIVPKVNIEARGAFVGLTGSADRLGMLKSVIDGLCYKTKEMLEAQKQVINGGFDFIMVGGGTNCRAWIQAKADILNRPVHVPHIKEATALGAAMLAGVGASVYSGYEDAMAAVGKLGFDVYEPIRENTVKYEELYGKYLKYIELEDNI